MAIKDLLDNKTFSEKSAIKSDAIIAAFDFSKPFKSSDGDLVVSVRSISKIRGGVEVFASATRGGKPVGFGSDGTVEIERFRYLNPPIMVPDGTKYTLTLGKGVGEHQEILDNFKEDPAKALTLCLFKTINLVGKDTDRVVSGKVGNTTSTFFPVAGAVSPCDGGCEMANAVASWATVQGAATGTSADATSVVLNGNGSDFARSAGVLRQNAGLGFMVARSIVNFDTSAIPDTDTVSAATLSLWGTSKTNELNSGEDAIIITPATPAGTDNVVTADFDQVGDIASPGTGAYSSSIDLSAIATAAYNDFALNATGLAAISKTGITTMGIRILDDDSTVPGFSSDQTNAMSIQSADFAGTGQDPQLVVTHGAAAAGTLIRRMMTGIGT